MMKRYGNIIIVYVMIALLLVIGFTFTLQRAADPEKLILGEWSELSWEYEKVNKLPGGRPVRQQISEEWKEQIGRGLIIHQAETWKFLPGGRLLLEGDDFAKIATWRIKGRGNILELKYDDSVIEHYEFTELSEQRMVLNFSADIQVRGIAKLTFEKRGSLYAQEVQ